MGKLQKLFKAAGILLVASFVLSVNVSHASNWFFDRGGDRREPVVYLYASKYLVKNGESVVLSWKSKNADACIAHGTAWSGLRSASSTETVSPTVTTKYLITCVNERGAHTDAVIIVVKGKAPTSPPPPPPPLPDPEPEPLGNLLMTEVNYLTSTLGEWVEIYNGTGEPVTMDGWTISDAIGSDLIATTTIPHGGFVLVTGSTTLAASLPGVSVITLPNTTIGSGLNDGGDALYLKDQNGNVVDSLSYGSNTDVFNPSIPIGGNVVIKRTSLTTDTHTATDWATSTPPTPGSF